jgi:hypothetical protein
MIFKLTSRALGFVSKVVGVIGICLSSGAAAYSFGDTDSLWRVVNDLCLSMQRTFGLPLPGDLQKPLGKSALS